MNEGHLIDVDSQERENAAVQYLCDTPFLLNDLLGPLGLHPNFYWVLLQVPHGKLVTGRFGDVDLMAGLLRLATKDGFEWPPMLDQLVAIEAKCAYRSPTEPAVKAQRPPRAMCGRSGRSWKSCGDSCHSTGWHCSTS